MIYFVGDIHGEFRDLANRIDARNISDSSLIQVGDFRLGFGNRNEEELALKTLNKTLKAGNNLLYVIRGNHDDPSYFEKWQKIGNIRLVPDYSILELEGYTLFLTGGSVSVDRLQRREGKGYWKDEMFRYEKSKLEFALSQVQKIDIVVTHSAPGEFWPYETSELVKSYAKRDTSLIADLTKDREMHSELLEYFTSKFSPSHWYYGHFHAAMTNQYKDLMYFALGEAEIREHFIN